MPVATSIGVAAAVVASVAFFWKVRKIPIPPGMTESEKGVAS
jgi:hypothetical protein